MKGSLLGAVEATRLLLSAHPAGDGGKAAPRNHRLNLQTDGGKGRKGGRGEKETVEKKQTG